MLLQLDGGLMAQTDGSTQMSKDLVFSTECNQPEKKKQAQLTLFTQIKARHGTRGLIASITLIGASIGGYALAYGLLVYFG